MNTLAPELLLLIAVLTCVTTCSAYHAGKIDQAITQRIADAMEVRR